MNCNTAQALILNADHPATLPDDNADLRAHLDQCPPCRQLLDRVIRIENTAAALTIPPAQDAREQTRARLRETTLRPRFLRPAWIGAVAALLVVGIGLGAYFAFAPSAPTLVDQLIDLDLELAAAQHPQERQQLYNQRAPRLESAVKNSRLSEEDRQLATALLRNGKWLTANADPLEQAERFSDIADVLVDRMDRAARARDARALQKLGRHYGQVMQVGIGPSLDKATAYIAPPQARLERLATRNAGHQKKLQAVLDVSPRASQKDIHKALEASKKQQFPKAGKKAPTTRDTAEKLTY